MKPKKKKKKNIGDMVVGGAETVRTPGRTFFAAGGGARTGAGKQRPTSARPAAPHVYHKERVASLPQMHSSGAVVGHGDYSPGDRNLLRERERKGEEE